MSERAPRDGGTEMRWAMAAGMEAGPKIAFHDVMSVHCRQARLDPENLGEFTPGMATRC